MRQLPRPVVYKRPDMHTPNPATTSITGSQAHSYFRFLDPASFFTSIPYSLELGSVSQFVSSSMKHPREADDQQVVSLSLSLSVGAAERSKRQRRGGAGAGGEFVCKTCSRAFATFQALGGHRTSHLRARHGLALGLAGGNHHQYDSAKTTGPAAKKTTENKAAATSHRCHVCGLGFEMGQALGGHMRRHREEVAAAQAPPVVLELFV